jgi:hypothetical protein
MERTALAVTERNRLRAAFQREVALRGLWFANIPEYQPWANYQRYEESEYREHPLTQKYVDFTKPHPQWLFNLSQARFKVLIGAPRGGKSIAPGYESTLDAAIPGNEVWFVAPTYYLATKEYRYFLRGLVRQHGKDILRCFKTNFDHGGPGGCIPWHEGETYVRCKTEDNKDSLLGDDCGTMVLCEAPRMSRQTWESHLRGRLQRVRGRVLGGYSGLPGDWCADEFEEKAERHPDYETFHITAFHNPTFDPQEAEDAKSTHSEPAWRHDFLGARVHYEGIVYGTWGTDGKQGWSEERFPDGNILPWVPKPELETCVSIDPGIGTASVGWWQVFDHKGTECAVRFDERVEQRWDTPAIREYLRRHPSFPYLRYIVIDPYKGRQTQSASGETDKAILRELGLPIREPPTRYRGESAIKARVEIVRSLICAYTGLRRLAVSPKCARWLNDRENFAYPERGADLDKPMKDSIHDHTQEETSYFAARRFPIRGVRELVI